MSTKIFPFLRKGCARAGSLIAAFFLIGASVPAQGGQIVYGDLLVDETQSTGLKPLSFDVILYREGGVEISRQAVSANGRYRFNNLTNAIYTLVVELEGKEVARVRVDVTSSLLRDLRQDISLEWRGVSGPAKSGVLSAGDQYSRSPVNEGLFKQASQAIDQKDYLRAGDLLKQIVRSDAKDFQAWAELANVHFLQKDFANAEIEYIRAIDAQVI